MDTETCSVYRVLMSGQPYFSFACNFIQLRDKFLSVDGLLLILTRNKRFSSTISKEFDVFHHSNPDLEIQYYKFQNRNILSMKFVKLCIQIL